MIRFENKLLLVADLQSAFLLKSFWKRPKCFGNGRLSFFVSRLKSLTKNHKTLGMRCGSSKISRVFIAEIPKIFKKRGMGLVLNITTCHQGWSRAEWLMDSPLGVWKICINQSSPEHILAINVLKREIPF